MRKLFLAGSILFFVSVVIAATAKFKIYQSLADFAKGESRGVTIRHEGKLVLAPQTKVIFEGSVPHIWRAAAAGGDLFLAGGDPATLFRLGRSGDTTRVFQSEDAVTIFALCSDGKGAIWFAPSPGGEVYRYEKGRVARVATLNVTYIWDLLPVDGGVFAATGEPGQIYRVSAGGDTSSFFASNETHLRCLAAGSGGTLYAGSADRGIVFKIDASGKPFVLYDADETEIFKVIAGRDGDIWAASASEGLQRPTPISPNVTVSEISIEGADDSSQGEEPAGGATLARSFSRQKTTSGAIYKISAGGVVKNYWQGQSDRVQSLLLRPDGRLLVGTGDAGKLFEIDPEGEIDQILDFSPAQITDLLAAGDGIIATTANAGTCLRILPALAASGEYLSAVLDADLQSQWGSISWHANGAVEISARSGNSEQPDRTWSEWSAPLAQSQGTTLNLPASRFMQWRAVLRNSGSALPELSDLTIGYLQKNVAPEIDQISILEPGVAYPDIVEQGKSNSPSVRRPKSAGNNGNAANPRGKKETIKGYRSISWHASDENGDNLVYDLSYQKVGTAVWRALMKDYTASIFSWDSQVMEDGQYHIKIVASDRSDNPPALARSAERLSQPFTIDNTPPEILELSYAQGRVSFVAEDRASRIVEVYFAVDAGEWQLVYPEDGIADSPRERFQIPMKTADRGQHTVTVKVYDEIENIRVAHVNFNN